MSEPESESQNFGHKNGLWVHIKLRCHTFSDSGSGLAFRTDYMDPSLAYLEIDRAKKKCLCRMILVTVYKLYPLCIFIAKLQIHTCMHRYINKNMFFSEDSL